MVKTSVGYNAITVGDQVLEENRSKEQDPIQTLLY